MPSFLENIQPFYGTGEKNASGQTLEEFLEAYDPDKYRTPGCTTDAVIFSYQEEQELKAGKVKVLLVRRGNHPSIGFWALPGGFVNMKENLADTAKRELYEETKVSGVHMEQIGTYGDYARDPRTRVITTAYMALVKEDEVTVQAGDDAADAAWWDIRLEQEDASGGRELCRLYLSCEEKGLSTEVLVEHTVRGKLIREEAYVVKEQGITAVDHGAILVQAYLRLKSRL